MAAVVGDGDDGKEWLSQAVDGCSCYQASRTLLNSEEPRRAKYGLRGGMAFSRPRRG